ncbi:MAG: hypothetical protein P1V81_13685 [Planctomycetota bacterium]|nr:hypothetical protein [Planctomycetota bacterium]
MKFSPLAAVVLLFGCPVLAAQTSSLTIHTLDDMARRVPGVPVEIVEQAKTWDLTSGQESFTAPATYQGPQTLLVTYHEAPTSGGTLLGQSIARLSGTLDGDIETLFSFQPTLRPYFADSNGILIPSGHSSWAISPAGPTSSYAFRAEIGMLVHADQIQALWDYYSASAPSAIYTCGLVLRTVGTTLGGAGASVAVRLKGHTMTGVPCADILTPSGQPVPANLQVQTEFWDPVSKVARFRVAGDLPRGESFLLVRDSELGGEGSSLHAPAINPPTIKLPSTITPTPKDCTVEAPEPPDSPALTCPGSPVLESSPYCPPPVLITSGQTYWGTFPAGDPICKPKGVGFNASVTTSYEGGVVTSVSIGSASFGVDGKVSKHDTHGVDYTFGGPCGQCYQEFYHVFAKIELWEIQVEGGMFHWDDCIPHQEEVPCLSALNTSNLCDRTDCP